MEYQKAYPEIIDELPQIQMQLSEEDFEVDHEKDIYENKNDGNKNDEEGIDIDNHTKQQSVSKQNHAP